MVNSEDVPIFAPATVSQHTFDRNVPCLFMHEHTNFPNALHHVSFCSGCSEMDVYNPLTKFFIQ